MDKQKAQAKADKLIEDAEKTLANTKIPPNERAAKHANLMGRYATLQASHLAEKHEKARWHGVAQEWAKAERAAQKLLANDKLDKIYALIGSFRKAGDALDELE